MNDKENERVRRLVIEIIDRERTRYKVSVAIADLIENLNFTHKQELAALKQELKQSLEAEKRVLAEPTSTSKYRTIEAVPMEAIQAVFQDKGDNRE